MGSRNTTNMPAIAVALLIATLMTGCATGSTIRSDYDHSADFSQYQTYNFYVDAGPESTNYQSLFSQYMVSAISKEMDDRGYEKSDDPDLLVNFNAVLRDKTKITTRPAPVSYRGCRPRRAAKRAGPTAYGVVPPVFGRTCPTASDAP